MASSIVGIPAHSLEVSLELLFLSVSGHREGDVLC